MKVPLFLVIWTMLTKNVMKKRVQGDEVEVEGGRDDSIGMASRCGAMSDRLERRLRGGSGPESIVVQMRVLASVGLSPRWPGFSSQAALTLFLSLVLKVM